MRAGIAVLLMTAAATTAGASPCDGPPPAVGAWVRGPILMIPDASDICVAVSPRRWIKVPIGPLQVDRSVLMSALFSRTANCVLVGGGRAVCKIDGTPLEEVVRREMAASGAVQPIK